MKDLIKSLGAQVLISNTGNRLAFAGLLGGLFIVMLLVIPLTNSVNFVPAQWNEIVSCERINDKASSDALVFTVHVLSRHDGEWLCDYLTSTQTHTDLFSKVISTWVIPEERIRQGIYEQRFSLIQIRPEILARIGDEDEKRYKPVAHYPEYQAYLISKQEQPTIEIRYFESRVIGLLADPSSRSGYRAPVSALRNAGFRLDQLKVKRYPSHAALREALDRGDVDLVASYWNDKDRIRFPDWYTLQIATVDQGTTWYLSDILYSETRFRCAVISSLHALSIEQGDGYFADLIVNADAMDGCDDLI